MKKIPLPSPGHCCFARLSLTLKLAVLLLAGALANDARANVYATNIRLNGGMTNLPLAGNVEVSYILNEPATRVVIEIKSGAGTVRTISITNTPPIVAGKGLTRGTNIVAWDGKDNSSNSLPSGTYSVQITTFSDGYDEWTKISDDTVGLGDYVWEPRGIAVNKNPNSPYYGRVFVGNANTGPNTNANIGDRIGLQKLNADGSPAAEGVFSTGGWDWAHGAPFNDFFSPWKIEVNGDDRVYVSDVKSNGLVLSFDQTISSASRQLLLRNDNWPDGEIVFTGLSVTDSGTNLQIWMADKFGSAGIHRWNVSTNGTLATNDLGTTIAMGADLDIGPFDLALGRSNRIYTIQNQVNGAPTFHVLAFSTFGATNPVTTADWKIGESLETMGAHGIAVDPSETYVAVAFTSGSTRLFYTTNGELAAIPTSGLTGGHDFRDVAWDNVGNLYVVDNVDSVWRVYSPPGTNQATTVSAAMVTVGSPVAMQPVLSEPSYSNGQFQCYLTGTPSATYYLEASTNLQSWFRVATNSSSLQKRPITVNAPFPRAFYRALAGTGGAPSGGPVLSAPSYSGGQFHFTLTGTPNVTYVIQSSTDMSGWTSVMTNSSANAVRLIDVPAAGNRAFYRARVGP